MERAVLFFDIDGTLLSEVTRTIPESAVHALEEARRKGHLVFINTGRTACSVPPEIRRLPVDGTLCGCGIYAEYRGQVIFEEHLDAKAAASIVEMAEKCRWMPCTRGWRTCTSPPGYPGLTVWRTPGDT